MISRRIRKTIRSGGYRFLEDEKNLDLRDYISNQSRLFVLTPLDPVFHKPVYEVLSPHGERVWEVIRYPESPSEK